MKLQESVRETSLRVMLSTMIASAVMLAVFFALNRVTAGAVPFGAGVVISGLVGGAVASLNFFLMAITVQKVAAMDSQEAAKSALTLSLRNRTLMQLIWAALTLFSGMVLPMTDPGSEGFLNPVAGILPLVFPSMMIKLLGAVGKLPVDEGTQKSASE